MIRLENLSCFGQVRASRAIFSTCEIMLELTLFDLLYFGMSLLSLQGAISEPLKNVVKDILIVI